MKGRRIVVLASGRGTNLDAMINAINAEVLKAEIVGVASNKKDSGALQIAASQNIPTLCFVHEKDKQTREEYDDHLAQGVAALHPDLIALAGWMRILTNTFINRFPNIINLHPALPNTFPGATGIQDALDASKTAPYIKETGAMVHHVVEEVDAGEVITQVKVPIYPEDNLASLTSRVQYFEKPILLEAVQLVLDKMEEDARKEYPKYGKVRDIYELNSEKDQLCVMHSNRLSAFDRHICDVPKKGTILNLLSKYWFNKTRHIVPNHLLHADENGMVVKKCTPFAVEVVVRGYITGNTKTSLWTHYNNGAREYSGIKFPDGLRKHQKIDTVITPTTKGEVDEPISAEDIVARKLMTQDEWDYVSRVALELFKYGQEHAEERGFLLVDTKYEFGKDSHGNILLIDELHTCDSSRFWVANSYKERMIMNQEPEKLDKDCIRDYIKADDSLDPYQKDDESQIQFQFPRKNNPDVEAEDLAQIYHVSKTYEKFYNQMTQSKLHSSSDGMVTSEELYNTYLEDYEPTAVIVAGSVSDKEHVQKLENAMKNQGVATVSYYSSAHKNTEHVLSIIHKHDSKPKKVVWVTVAGRSNALSGVVAANSRNPVIGCPPFKDKMDMATNINSTLQCPSKVPVMTILEPGNVAISIRRIFNLQ